MILLFLTNTQNYRFHVHVLSSVYSIVLLFHLRMLLRYVYVSWHLQITQYMSPKKVVIVTESVKPFITCQNAEYSKEFYCTLGNCILKSVPIFSAVKAHRQDQWFVCLGLSCKDFNYHILQRLRYYNYFCGFSLQTKSFVLIFT